MPHSAEAWWDNLTEEEREALVMAGVYGFPIFGAGAMFGNFPRSKPAPYVDMPQDLADELAAVADKATEWFHDPKQFLQVNEPEIEPITATEVRDRIQGFQFGMDREIARISHFRYDNAWNWRFDDNWRELHQEWVDAFNLELLKPEFAAEVRKWKVWRYDLSSMPWQLQYVLCVRWQQIWHKWKESGRFDPVEAAKQRAKAKAEVDRMEQEGQTEVPDGQSE